MGGYNIGGGYPYNPLANTAQTQNTAPAVSTGIGNFDLNDPTAFLKSIGSKLSAALSPISINRNEFRSDVNQAYLDKLNIKLVDAPPPVYNNYPTQGYNAPYPNQGYAQGGGQQIIPVYVQTPNGPQISGYVTIQTPQQPLQQYSNYGGQQTYPQPIEQYQPFYGYADPNFTPPNYPDTTTQEIPFPTARPFSTGNSSWLSGETANKIEAPPPPPTDGVLNPIVNSTIETTTP